MRTLNVTISDMEYNHLGLKGDELSYSDLKEIVGKELTRQNLDRSIELADKYGLAYMDMEDITNEVNSIRKNAKGNH